MKGEGAMNELPDVEMYKRYFNATALHQGIKDVEVYPASLLAGGAGPGSELKHKGRAFRRVERHGTYLLAGLDDGTWLAFPFGESGYLRYFKRQKRKPCADRIQFTFDNGYNLAYVSGRRLRRITQAETVEQFVRSRGLGPDALDPALDADAFRERLKDYGGVAVREGLHDQRMVAGIGERYADEILFQARIHPKRRIGRLSEDEVDRLFAAMKSVLTAAVEAGAKTENLPDHFLLPRLEKDGDCPVCGNPLRRPTVCGKPAACCDICQPRS